VIKANALTRTYGDLIAVSEVSFEIGKNEIVALLGQNGAGKSTLMKMITGCLEPTSGSVEFNGLNMSSNRKEIQQFIGFLSEDCPLYNEMQVIEYLDFIADLRGVKPGEKSHHITYAVTKMSLQDVTGKLISTLSRGYRQRLGMAQTLLNSPSLLVLDEPMNGLDPSQNIEMREFIRELAKTSTVLLSTHNLQDVQAVSERVIILNKGSITLDAKLADLQTTSTLEVLTNADEESFQAILIGLGLENLKTTECVMLETMRKYIFDTGSANSSSEIAASLTSLLVAKGFRIYGARPIIRDLESIFADTTIDNVNHVERDAN
jgi:ABC-2 type transport system ATP-binding protein